MPETKTELVFTFTICMWTIFRILLHPSCFFIFVIVGLHLVVAVRKGKLKLTLNKGIQVNDFYFGRDFRNKELECSKSETIKKLTVNV